MDKLIEALLIFRKYGNPTFPTHCEHDTLYVLINPKIVSEEDLGALEELGFSEDYQTGDTFSSWRYGSA